MAVSLPDVNSDAGLLARLFLAEARNPGHGSYNADDAARGMRAMKAVVHNRLHRNPAQFGAPGASSFLDIVTAPGQFHGFSKTSSGQLQIAADVSDRISTIVSKANSGPPGKYHAFVELAIQEAQSPVDDPFTGVTFIGGIAVTGGAYGWRTEGSSSPGGNFVAIPVANGGAIAGNQFFTLRVTQPHGGAAINPSFGSPLDASHIGAVTIAATNLCASFCQQPALGVTPANSPLFGTQGTTGTAGSLGGTAGTLGTFGRNDLWDSIAHLVQEGAVFGSVGFANMCRAAWSKEEIKEALHRKICDEPEGSADNSTQISDSPVSGATAGTGGTVGSFCGCGGTFGTAGSAGGSTQLTGSPVSGATLGTQGTFGTAGSLGATGGTVGSFCGCGGTFGTAGSAGGSTQLSGSPVSGATAGTSGTAGTSMCVLPSSMPATFQGASIGTQATFCARSQ